MSKPFVFKQFTVHQDLCAMKIGTDSILLGAWASIINPSQSVLDIGTGTGVLALMLAQRTNTALIDAIEIDDAAFEQSVTNFENSPWRDRLYSYHASLKAFTEEFDDTYDIIVSNPPFYSEDFKTLDEKRNKARFNVSLPFTDLISSVSKLLSKQGRFSVIIPYSASTEFILLALQFKLYLNRRLNIKGHSGTKIKRSLLEFTFTKKQEEVNPHQLVIETSRHNYTPEYINLVKDFYLNL